MNLRLASLAALSLVTVANVAFAEEPAAPGAAGAPREEKKSDKRYPVAQAERPLTLPRMVLNIEGELGIGHIGEDGGGGAYVNLTAGGSFGITDDLTVRATVLPLQLTGPAPLGGARYGQNFGEAVGPSVGATYRFLKNEMVEVGASLDATIYNQFQYSGLGLAPGAVARIHPLESLRIDAGVYIPLVFGSDPAITMDGFAGTSTSHTRIGVKVPVSVLYDITEPIHVGVSSGIEVRHDSDVVAPASSTTTIVPLGIFAGYAIAGQDGPIIDIDPFFTFNGIAGSNPDEAPGTSYWVAGVTVGGFLYL